MILRSLSAPDAEKFYTLMCTAAGRELPREAFAQALAQALEQTGRRIVLAFEGPEAVGFADTEVRFPFSECAPVGVIHEFYVREDARGRNVGSAMLVSLTTQFKAAGCVSVQASCARVNLKSQEFLEKRGFVKTTPRLFPVRFRDRRPLLFANTEMCIKPERKGGVRML